jgi:hypothetical protein
LGNFIISVAEYIWIACLLTLVLSLFIPVTQSSRATAIIWVVMGLIMDRVAPELMALSAWNAEIARHVWYLTWVVFDTLTVFLIFYVHQRFTWQYSKLSQYITLCCVVLAILQTARFMDRVLFKTELLTSIYKYGVPSINIAVGAAIVLWLVSSMTTMKKGS